MIGRKARQTGHLQVSKPSHTVNLVAATESDIRLVFVSLRFV